MTTNRWAEPFNVSKGTILPLYAISDIITHSSSVPEPDGFAPSKDVQNDTVDSPETKVYADPSIAQGT